MVRFYLFLFASHLDFLILTISVSESDSMFRASLLHTNSTVPLTFKPLPGLFSLEWFYTRLVISVVSQLFILNQTEEGDALALMLLFRH